MSRARSSRLWVGLVLGKDTGRQLDPPRQHRPALDEDELAGDGDERADVAEPVVVERGERIEVGLGEVAERHREDVELAGFDERQEQAERARRIRAVAHG